MLPSLMLNIYPPLRPADSRSAPRYALSPGNRASIPAMWSSPLSQMSPCPPSDAHTHTHTHTAFPDLISGLRCPVSPMTAYFLFSHQATVLPLSGMGRLWEQVTKDGRK